MVAEAKDSLDEIGDAAPVKATTASEDMKAGREAAGLTLEELAVRTRVPQRHLEALEEGRYSALPGITCCAGFSRAYARAVNLDEAQVVAKVRSEVEAQGMISTDRYVPDEPVLSNSIPPRYLAWTAAVLALLIAGGYAIWRMQLNTQPTDQEIAQAARPETRITTQGLTNTSSGVAAPALLPSGPVVLTAADAVWLRIYDGEGKRLLEKTMAKGETFTVPADANNPMILTGRPDALAVTVGGQAVPPLGTAERTIADVPISAAALIGRASAPAEPSVGNSAAPAAGRTIPTVRANPRASGNAPTAEATPRAAGNSSSQ